MESIQDVKKFINKVQDKSCLVVGDIILDKYVYGEVDRISPEAPIPVINVAREQYSLGGAANVAANICGYYVKTYLCGLLGKDKNAIEIRELLSGKNIDFLGIESSKRRTTMKTRIIGMNQQLIRIDQEDNIAIDAEDENGIMAELVLVLPKVQVVVLSDYNKGTCSNGFCQQVIDICKRAGKVIIVDPKSDDWTKYRGSDLITPNFKEFQRVVGHGVENTETAIRRESEFLFEQYGLPQILVTRSQYGMTLVKSNGKMSTFQSVQHEVFDVSGAGDTVIATIAAFLAAGVGMEEAIEISNYAAGLAVSKMGTYMVTLEEVAEYINHIGLWYEDKIWNIDKLYAGVKLWRQQGEKIVFTNGCFDILHLGHIEYLNKARRLGSKMIVGLNTDVSVRRLKGVSRPVNNQQARALALAALQCVDAVVLFDEDTPEKLIRIVAPDCLVKGGDYKVQEIIGRQYASKVCTIPLVTGYSTTEIFKKIKASL